MPENDDDVAVPDNVADLLADIDAVQHDDTLIDLVGDGYDVNAPGDQAVADLLGTWRDGIRSTPVDRSQLPSAHTARGQLPPVPTTGGKLSISEDAAALADIGADETVSGGCTSAVTGLNDEIMPLLQEAKGTLDDDSAQAVGLLGANQSAQNVGQAGEQAKSDMTAAFAAVQAAVQAIQAAQAAAQAFYSAVAAAATQHGA